LAAVQKASDSFRNVSVSNQVPCREKPELAIYSLFVSLGTSLRLGTQEMQCIML